MIVAKIVSGDGYEVAPTGQTAVVKVIDNDLPRLTLSVINSSVTEAEDARFLISTSSIMDSSISVPVAISDLGDYIEGSEGILEVTFPATRDRLVFSIAIHDDEIDEPDNYITARILESDNE